ncbi:MAG TPA: peptidoglycan DD-metalloendopeptidase family protein [Anaerolineales bacterium]
MRRLVLWLVVAASLLFVVQPASAQASGPVYIVQPGDTISSIANRFNVSISDLMTANNISDPNVLGVGQQLVIPGLEGITGVLDTETINFGDSLHSLLRRTQIPLDLLRRLNHVVSPTQFYVGASLIVPKQDQQNDLTTRLAAASGQSLLELAVQANANPWTLAALNGLGGTWDALPGDVLYAAGSAGSDANASGLPAAFGNVTIPTLPFTQGKTGEIIVQPVAGTTLSGTLGTYPLHFFPLGDGRMVALQGIHAMLEPGIYPLQLNATEADGSTQSYQQMVVIASGKYPKEALSVPSEMIDPAVTGPEDQQVLAITAPLTPTKTWQGPFSLPVAPDYCIKDWFGMRRSFNGSDYNFFHAGVDFGICSVAHPFDIYAAAPGKVVFAGPLTVRGNATFIDHGWGIYTAYFHQKQIEVGIGQQVQAGQLIGQIGETGRVTGPHLHWEVWVDGIQVNPLDWLTKTFP